MLIILNNRDLTRCPESKSAHPCVLTSLSYLLNKMKKGDERDPFPHRQVCMVHMDALATVALLFVSFFTSERCRP